MTSDSRVLIVGGGTGYVLDAIARLNLSGLNIDYVESSQGMLQLAEMRSISNQDVRFINESWPSTKANDCYDVIITQFFLDSFDGNEFHLMFSSLDVRLKEGGLWIVADFQLSKDLRVLWQLPMLRLMYLFFKITVGIQASRLEDIAEHFASTYKELICNSNYYGTFIFSSTYRKMKK